MPVYEYRGQHYDIDISDPAEAKNKILQHLAETNKSPEWQTFRRDVAASPYIGEEEKKMVLRDAVEQQIAAPKARFGPAPGVPSVAEPIDYSAAATAMEGASQAEPVAAPELAPVQRGPGFMLRPEFVQEVRSAFAAIPPEKRRAALEQAAKGRGAEAQAAQRILEEVRTEDERRRIDMLGQERMAGILAEAPKVPVKGGRVGAPPPVQFPDVTPTFVEEIDRLKVPEAERVKKRLSRDEAERAIAAAQATPEAVGEREIEKRRGETQFLSELWTGAKRAAMVDLPTMWEGAGLFKDVGAAATLGQRVNLFDRIDSGEITSPDQLRGLDISNSQARSYLASSPEDREKMRKRLIDQVGDRKDLISTAIRTIEDYQQDAAQYRPLVDKPRNIGSVEDFTNWLGSTIGSGFTQTVPLLLIAAATGGVGLTTGSIGMELGQAVNQRLKYIKEQTKDLPKEQQVDAFVEYLQKTGDTTLLSAVVSGALDALLGPEARLVKMRAGEIAKEATRIGAVKRELKEVPGQVAGEGVTGALQQAVQIAAGVQLKEKPEFWTKENIIDILESGAEEAAGSLGGAGVNVGIAATRRPPGAPRPAEPTAEEPPAAPPTAPLSAEDRQLLLDNAQQRLAELELKARGKEEQVITTPEGKKVRLPAEAAQFLTDDERAELAFLRGNATNADALQRAYEVSTEQETAPGKDVTDILQTIEEARQLMATRKGEALGTETTKALQTETQREEESAAELADRIAAAEAEDTGFRPLTEAQSRRMAALSPSEREAMGFPVTPRAPRPAVKVSENPENIGMTGLDEANRPVVDLITAGAKPFPTKKAAEMGKAQRPDMKILKVADGWMLTPMTEADVARGERAGQRISAFQPGKAGMPTAAHEYIMERGGLTFDQQPNTDFPDENPKVGNRRLFSDKGMSLAQAAELLKEAGYIDEETETAAQAAISNSVKGKRVYTPEGYERAATLEQEAQTREAEQAETEAGLYTPEADIYDYRYLEDPFRMPIAEVRTRAEAVGIPYDVIAEDVASRMPDATQEEYEDAVKTEVSNYAKSEGKFLNIRRTPLGFYSALEAGIEGLPTTAAPAAGWKAAIKGLVNKGAAKQDEVDWTGLNDWLDLQQGRVTKEQVQEYLRNGGVQVEEVVLGGKDRAGDWEQIKGGWRRKIGNRWMHVWEPDFEGKVYGKGPSGLMKKFASVEAGKAYFDGMDYTASTTPTKYGQYQLPGGENYREVLLTLPGRMGADSIQKAQNLDAKLSELRRVGMERYGSRAFHLEYLNEVEQREYELAEAQLQTLDEEAERRDRAYQSSHWDQGSVLAHIRVNDRTDADGNKVLFVEEIQSDWGQEGKKKGFAGASPEEVVKRAGYRLEKIDGTFVVFDADGDAMGDGPTAELAARRAGLSVDGIPAAPFVTKTEGWLNLALKRIMVMAAEGGYDKVAFVTGQQSADRFDLSKQVDSIVYAKEDDGNYSLVAIKDGREVVKRDSVEESALPDLVGKEVAERIINGEGKALVGGPERELTGDGLKVGGEGMKAFYDKIVPAALKKLLPKVGGGQMGVVEINNKSQPGFDVTPAMRETTQTGVPLFQIANKFTSEIGQATERSPSLKRKVKTLRRQRLAGKISDAQFIEQTDAAIDQDEAARLAKAPEGRLRGADRIREVLLAAKRRGELSPEAVDLAEWFIKQNEKLLDDLAVSVKSPERGTAGRYEPMYRLMILMKEAGSDNTIVHEILHHLERMMPEPVRKAIRKEWMRQLMLAQKKAKTPAEKLYFAAIMANHFGEADMSFADMNKAVNDLVRQGRLEPMKPLTEGDSAALHDLAINLARDGAVPMSHYQYVNPSEFWAVKGSDIVQGRYNAIRGGVLARLKNWLKELGQTIKALFGLRSDAPLIKALDSLAKGDGKFVSKKLIGEGDTFLQISGQPTPPSAPTPAAPPKKPLVVRAAPILFSADELNRPQFRAGVAAYKGVANIANKVLDKLYLKPASPELARAMRDMKAEINKVQNKLADVAAKLEKLPVAEREMISDVIEGELLAGVTPPKHVLDIAAAMQQMMREASDEAIRLDMLSPQAVQRWGDKYLPRFYQNKLRDDTKAWARAARALFARQPMMKGVVGRQFKGRGMFYTVDVNELPDWIAEGWEQRDPDFDPATSTETVVWRDYTREERENMGEIRDAMFRFVMGYNGIQRDLALGRLYESLADEYASKVPKEGYDRVPETKVEGTNAYRYGKLAGLYVPREIRDHLSLNDQSMMDGVYKIYRAGLAKWKEGKTVLNPVAHANNVLSNVTMAHFAGVSYWDGHKYVGAVKDLATNSDMVKEADDVGLFGGTFSQEEFMGSMPPKLRQMANMTASSAAKLGDKIWDTLAYTVSWNGKKYGARPVMQWMYDGEDKFFRYVIYRDARLRGLDPKDARDYAQEFIFTYDDLPKGARLLRDFGMPFFGYTYKVIPVLLQTVAKYPWRFAAPASVAYAANAMMYAIAASLGGDDDDSWAKILYKYVTDAEFRKKAQELEDEERKNLPPWLKGLSSLVTPKAIRLWMDDATNLPLFLDISRIFPGGDLLDAENNAGGVALLQPLTPNNPVLTTLVAMLANKDMFRGKDVVEETDTPSEKAAKQAAWLWKQITPAISVGNYHFDRAMNVIANITGKPITVDAGPMGTVSYTGIGKDGLPVQPKYALLQTMGVKVRPYDLEQSKEIEEGKQKKLIREIQFDMSRLDRLLDKGSISEEAYNIEYEKLEKKKDFLEEGLTVSGKEKK